MPKLGPITLGFLFMIFCFSFIGLKLNPGNAIFVPILFGFPLLDLWVKKHGTAQGMAVYVVTSLILVGLLIAATSLGEYSIWLALFAIFLLGVLFGLLKNWVLAAESSASLRD